MATPGVLSDRKRQRVKFEAALFVNKFTQIEYKSNKKVIKIQNYRYSFRAIYIYLL